MNAMSHRFQSSFDEVHQTIEREADDTGWQYLLKANIDPRGMIRFFDRLKKEEQKYPLSGSLQLLNTHPATDERMKRLEEKWKKLDRKDGFRKL